ncbi:MAG: SOS response-associated peptidase [Cyclobacteriaceae bacterium]|nr:SOS response-associated peptidase [Cyclobacteriaceae bacterium]
MCTRFSIASGVAAIEQEFQAEFQYEFHKVYNAHFGIELPVIVSGSENKIINHQWGLIPFWAKSPDLKFHNINSPASNIVKNPAYRVPIRRRRCLVLANCFFVWIRSDKGQKVPHVVYDASQRLMSFAGIWDTWNSPDGLQSKASFSIVTTHANKRLARFTRQMPVIIPPGRRRKFLRDSLHLNEVMAMLRPIESDSINLYPVSEAVNDFQLNTKEILMPVGQRLYREYTYVPRVYLKLEGMGSTKEIIPLVD